MTYPLYVLLEITLGAALTAIAIILIRLVFHRWLTAKAKYYLWLLLALRLCLPVLPGSPTSVRNWIPQPEFGMEEAAESPEMALATISEPQKAPVGNTAISASEPVAAVEQTELQAAKTAVIPEVPVEQETARSLSLSEILLTLWLVGAGITVLIQAILYCITMGKLKKLPICGDPDTLRTFLGLKRKLGYKGKARLSRGSAGMSGGLMHPVIVLPAEVHGETAVPILLHELKHIQSGDLWILAFYRLLCGIWWFNPVVWLSFWQLKRDCEAANDQRVLETGLVSPVDYATVLYAEGIAAMVYGATQFGGSDHDIRNRIKMISRFKKPALWVTVLAVLLGALICACTLTGAPTEKAPSEEESPYEEEQEDSLPAGYKPSADTLEAATQKYGIPFGEFGLTYEEMVSAGYLDPETCEIGDETEHSVIYEGKVELNGETLEATFVFSATQFTLGTDGKQVLTEVHVRIPTSVTDKDTWIESISDPWGKNMYGGTAVQFYNSPETVSDFLMEEQQKLAAERAVENGEEPDLTAAESALRNWVLAQYFVRYDEFIFNGTGIALCKTAPPMENASETGTGFAPYSADASEITYQNAQWGMTYSEVLAAEEISLSDWTYSDSGKPEILKSQPYEDCPEVSSVTYLFDYAAPRLAYVLSNVEVTYDAAQTDYSQLVAQRTRELGEPDYQDEKKVQWTVGNSVLQLQDGKTILREYLRSGIINSPLEGLETADWDTFYKEIQPPNGEYGLTYQEHLDRGLLKESEGTYEEKSEIVSIFTTEILLGGEMVPAEYVFSKTMATMDAGEQVLIQVIVELPDGIDRRNWVLTEGAPWLTHMMGSYETKQWYTPYRMNDMLTEEQQAQAVKTLVELGDVETEEAGYDYLAQWPLVMNHFGDGNWWIYNGTGLALYRTMEE